MNIFPESKDIFWAAVNFLVLVGLLYKFLYGPVLGMMDKRSKDIEENIERAEKANQEAEALRVQLADQAAQAQAQAQETLAAARKAAEASRDEILTQARSEAARMIEKAQAAIEREKDAALAELRQEVADLAIAAAGKVIGKSLDTADHRRLVTEFMQGVRN